MGVVSVTGAASGAPKSAAASAFSCVVILVQAVSTMV